MIKALTNFAINTLSGAMNMVFALAILSYFF